MEPVDQFGFGSGFDWQFGVGKLHLMDLGWYALTAFDQSVPPTHKCEKFQFLVKTEWLMGEDSRDCVYKPVRHSIHLCAQYVCVHL